MTDKELIKQEIERLKTQNETYLDKEYAYSTKWYKHGAYDICNSIGECGRKYRPKLEGTGLLFIIFGLSFFIVFSLLYIGTK